MWVILMNNKGFAITTMVFGLLIIASLVLFGALATYSSSKRQSTSFVDYVESELHKDEFTP